MMKLLVTGGAGFIGSNFVRWALANAADSVVVLDALTYAGNKANLQDFQRDPRMSFVHGDVCDRAAVQQAMSGCDVVVHFAAESHVDRSIVGPDAFVLTNCYGTNVVCDVARQLEVKKLLHISTDEVYGSVDEGAFAEGDRLVPSSPYAASKAASDMIAMSYWHTFGLPVTITRSTNNFGPYQHPEKLISLFATNLLDGQQLPLYGDGLNVRDWCYVTDNCEAIGVVLEHGMSGEVYNIAGGNEVTNLELTKKLLAIFSQDESAISYVTDRLGHDRRYCVNVSKIAKLGWKPTWELDDALARTVDWYRCNRWWWEPLKQAVPQG